MRPILGFLAVSFVLALEPVTQAWQESRERTIPAAEFSRLVGEFSERDGYFRSDNFVSNETSYLHIVDRLQGLEAQGGAYIGVGPEQNFTYIAKVRPRIAFIVDIRRQAVIQHLMFKALFHLAKDRTQFLSYLFSKPVTGKAAPGPEAPIEKILDYFAVAPTDAAAFAGNLAAIRVSIEKGFLIPLSERDRVSLEYVYTAFRAENLSLRYRFGSPGWPSHPWGQFPTFKDMILEKDLRGKLGNFLTSPEEYEFIRGLQERNRIIPVVGDFGGTKALSAVADYLKSKRYRVAVFYTSNVEQYLFSNGVFKSFVENVKKLPTDDKSLFIRSFPNLRTDHPARINGHRLTTLLQKISVFVNDYEAGLYPDYWSLATTHFIAPDAP